MIKHYILTVNPHSQNEWDKLILRNPITGHTPDFAEMIAESVEGKAGSYLIALNLEVTVLEESKPSSSKILSFDLSQENTHTSSQAHLVPSA